MRRQLKAACERLARQPGIGHVRGDLSGDPGIRFWRLGQYLIVYRNDPIEGVEIARILHGSRDIASLLEDESPDLE